MTDFSSLQAFNDFALGLTVVLGMIYLISGIDDIFIDTVAYLYRLRPQKLDQKKMQALDTLAQKQIAIIVPAWDEGNVIDRMITGNLSRVDYANYHFFIGVYPNDPVTVDKVQALEKKHPTVHTVLNDRKGPTSKGQILNRVIQYVLAFETINGMEFDAFHMQDAEDLMHPKVLKLVNYELDQFGFIQTPVFSLEVNASQWVAGTYMDEFAECHTKDILVREKLGAAIPSAGVGTTLSRDLVFRHRQGSRENLFNEESLTEDYELGIISHALGIRPHFACQYYLVPGTERREYIATREYFPKRFSRSIRQKTRWTTGIAIQGWRHLGWSGSLSNRYFLVRDRKGILTNIATFLGYPTLALVWSYAHFFDSKPMNDLVHTDLFRMVLAANLAFMINRFAQRTLCTWRVYGFRSVLNILIRWPIGITINALAGIRALKADIVASFTHATLTWSKTEHELPEYFGRTANHWETTT